LLLGVADFEIHAEWRTVLGQVLAGAERLGAKAVLAFDLDSTLLDNRPRQAALVHRFVKERGDVPVLANFDVRHLHTGFDMGEALLRQGLGADEAQRFLARFRPYWRANFFTSDACQADVPVRGAPEYVRRTFAAGAQLAYVTARPELMRPGTLETLGRHGFPLPGSRVELWMKADAEATDEDFKRSTHRHLLEKGTVLAAFDNEPGHANDYRASFPEATVVLLATGHSGRVSVLAEGIVAVPHFGVRSEEG
jgi:hypothetical protein